jgi:hypothetical protein
MGHEGGHSTEKRMGLPARHVNSHVAGARCAGGQL